jgi:hypothetical protein
MSTHNDIQTLQAREALEEVKNRIQIRTDMIKSQNFHSVHCGCQADSNHFLQEQKYIS